MLQEAGFHPLEVIRSATLLRRAGAARAEGQADRVRHHPAGPAGRHGASSIRTRSRTSRCSTPPARCKLNDQTGKRRARRRHQLHDQGRHRLRREEAGGRRGGDRRRRRRRRRARRRRSRSRAGTRDRRGGAHGLRPSCVRRECRPRRMALQAAGLPGPRRGTMHRGRPFLGGPDPDENTGEDVRVAGRHRGGRDRRRLGLFLHALPERCRRPRTLQHRRHAGAAGARPVPGRERRRLRRVPRRSRLDEVQRAGHRPAPRAKAASGSASAPSRSCSTRRTSRPAGVGEWTDGELLRGDHGRREPRRHAALPADAVSALRADVA